MFVYEHVDFHAMNFISMWAKRQTYIRYKHISEYMYIDA